MNYVANNPLIKQSSIIIPVGDINLTFGLCPLLWNILPNRPGVYLALQYDAARNTYYPRYIGQAIDIAKRLSSHERKADFLKCGTTHYAYIVLDKQSTRDYVEKYLIQKFNPTCNTQLTTN